MFDVSSRHDADFFGVAFSTDPAGLPLRLARLRRSLSVLEVRPDQRAGFSVVDANDALRMLSRGTLGDHCGAAADAAQLIFFTVWRLDSDAVHKCPQN